VAEEGDGGASSQVEEEDLSEVVRLGSVCEWAVDVLAVSAPARILAALDDKPRRSKAGTSLSEYWVEIAGELLGFCSLDVLPALIS
jgi:hypothetical protein